MSMENNFTNADRLEDLKSTQVANKKGKEPRVCQYCGKIFIPNRSRQKFCTKECSGKSLDKKVTLTCDYCGKEFRRKKCDVDRSKTHFCSRECRYAAISWTDEDVEILKENYGKIPNSELQKMLSVKHSVREMCRKALRLGVGTDPFWTKEEHTILMENYGKISMEELCKLLPNRTVDGILGHAHANHILSPTARLQYTDEEITFLKENYTSMSNFRMAKALGRTVQGITGKLHDLGLIRRLDVPSCSYKNLEHFVRRRINRWVDRARSEFNNTCVLTGSQEDIEVHHIHGFNLLIEETAEILDFPDYEDFGQYTDEQLELFLQTFMDLQEEYHEYTCVTKEAHRLFHTEYGFGDNTKDQWDEFVERYKSGYYDKVA